MKYFGEFSCWDDVLNDFDSTNLPKQEPKVIVAFKNFNNGRGPNRYLVYYENNEYYTVTYSGTKFIGNFDSTKDRLYAVLKNYPEMEESVIERFNTPIELLDTALFSFRKPLIEI